LRYILTDHARRMLDERAIPLSWVERTIERPAMRTPDPSDPDLERLYLAIPECEMRVLRVVVNTAADPVRVVSVFLDRRMRGKL